MEETKRNNYEQDLDKGHMAFAPFVMESVGGFGSSCDAVLTRIGRPLADIERISVSKAIFRIKQRIQCRWMRMLGAALAAQAFKS